MTYKSIYQLTSSLSPLIWPHGADPLGRDATVEVHLECGNAGASNLLKKSLPPKEMSIGTYGIATLETEADQAFARLVAPLREAYDRLSLTKIEQLQRASLLDACVTLLEDAAAASGQKGLGRSLRAFKARDTALALAGGIMGPSELAHKLGRSRQTIKDWGDKNKILWVDDHGLRSYPLCQFDQHGQILGGLDRFLQTLAASGITGWMALDALTRIDPKFRLSPLELLEQGRSDDAVLCAEALTEGGAA